MGEELGKWGKMVIDGMNPYGSKHCLGRYLPLQTIENNTPVPLPKKVLGFIWLNMGLLWNQYGFIWDCYGITMGSIWLYMGLLWDYYGINMVKSHPNHLTVLAQDLRQEAVGHIEATLHATASEAGAWPVPSWAGEAELFGLEKCRF